MCCGWGVCGVGVAEVSVGWRCLCLRCLWYGWSVCVKVLVVEVLLTMEVLVSLGLEVLHKAGG